MSKYEPVSAEVVAALQTALGAEYVRTDAETLEKYLLICAGSFSKELS